ncbi:MAG: hypothetical protein WD069_05440 [Planctomycetales bacterium]
MQTIPETMADIPNRRTARLAIAVVGCAMLAGCVQIETRVKLELDGSATITERIRFSQRLLDLSASLDKSHLSEFLTKSAALERMKHMGEGIELIEHEIRDAKKGARESVCVFKIPDIRDLRYVSPFLAASDYAERNVVVFDLAPVYEDRWYFGGAGRMVVDVRMAEPGKRMPEEAVPAATPLELQRLRDLQPVFRDMLSGFRFRLVFESYAPLRFGRGYYRWRGSAAATREFDLIDISDEDMDNFGWGFLENEEVMLELLKGELAGANVVEHVKEQGTNLTLPVVHHGGVPPIVIPTSRELFDRYFLDENGRPRMLRFHERRGPGRPADPEKDVYQEQGLGRAAE